jgi:hypothetical protein
MKREVAEKKDLVRSGFVKASGTEERQEGGESSMMTDDMRMERERERWERDAQERKDKPLNLHYDTRNEIRTMGVGNLRGC